MKDSAVTLGARPEDSSAFQRFAKVMRALVAVPKRELDEKLASERKTRNIERKEQRR